MKRPSTKLPLIHALSWIVGSVLVTSVSGHLGFKAYFNHRFHQMHDPGYRIVSIVQTGPQREALKTDYLAELLDLSSDDPPCSMTFDLRAAEEKLRSSPLIEKAQVKLLDPSTLYVDYTVRQPIAWLADYENTVIDKEGFPFPFRPFFTPKNLPELYFGMGPFGEPNGDLDRPVAQWGKPLQGKVVDHALHLLTLLTAPPIQEQFQVRRIDLSQAFAESCGSREIVVAVEDKIFEMRDGKQIAATFPKILRLSTQNAAQDLGNYLSLRPKLLEQERSVFPPSLRGPEKILDFRIQNLAFIDSSN